MPKAKKIKWAETARRGKAPPLLVIDSIVELYRQGYFAKSHKVNWNPKNYRQFDNARWFSEKDKEKYVEILKRASASGRNNLFTYAKEYEKRIKAFREFGRKFGNFDFSKADNKKLAGIFAVWFEHTKRIWCFGYDYIFINQFLPDIVISIIDSRVKEAEKRNKYLEILFEADKASEMRQEKQSLIRLANLMRQKRLSFSSKIVSRRLKKYLGKFAHLGFYMFRGKAHTFRDLKGRLKEYLRFSLAQMKKIQEDFKMKEENNILIQKIIKELKLDKRIVLQINYLKRWASLSNYVEETYAYVVYKLIPLWQEICKRLKITYPEFYSLTSEKTVSALKAGKSPQSLKKETRQREKDYALILEKGKKYIFVGKKLENYYRQEKQAEPKFGKIKELSGQSVSSGRACGRVKLVFSIDDAAKTKRGNI
jgi:hypothetical protein